MIPSSVVRSSLVVALLLACSPPSRPPTPRQTLADAPTPDAAPVVTIDAPPQPYTFPWEQLRARFDDVVAGKTSCDFRKAIVDGRVGTGDCAAPTQMAAKVFTRIVIEKDGLRAVVEADLAFPEGITKEWYGALLDERGRLATDWVHPDEVQLNRTWLTFRVNDKRAKDLKRAALVKERP